MRQSRTIFAQGFTLVEMVIVIVITGIIAGMVAVFIRLPVQGYVDSAARAELVDAADTALRRMSRDLRLALPNSVRVTTAGGRQYIEFLLTKTGGRYLAEEDNPTAGTILSFTDNTQRTFIPIGMPATVAPEEAIRVGDWIVVYNLGPGFDPADAYNCAGTPVACNRAQVSSVAFGNTFLLADNPFANQVPALPSPGRHYHVVTSPVTYVCDPAARTLTRYWNYTINAAQPADIGATPLAAAPRALLATGVTACNFDYDNVPGNLANRRNGLVGLSLTMETPGGNSGAVTLFYQVHVDNTP